MRGDQPVPNQRVSRFKFHLVIAVEVADEAALRAHVEAHPEMVRALDNLAEEPVLEDFIHEAMLNVLSDEKTPGLVWRNDVSHVESSSDLP